MTFGQSLTWKLNNMNPRTKLQISITVSLFIFAILGMVFGHYFFPTYLPETVASQKCRDMGGEFEVSYRATEEQHEWAISTKLAHPDGIVLEERAIPTFTCTSPSKTLFKYEN